MALLLMANSEINPHIQHNTYRRCCLIYLLILLIDEASLHRSAEGVEGGSVRLQCIHRNIILEEKQLTIHWRHNDTRNVYDIIHGKASVKEQDSAYKNRAEVSPEELKKGQIFLKLNDLQLSDRGTYQCFIPALRVHHSTQLLVKEQAIAEYRAVQVRSYGTRTSLGTTLHLLLPLSGFIQHFVILPILLFR